MTEETTHANVTEALSAVMGEMPAIERKRNTDSGVKYAFRGIEEIAPHVKELFAKYGVIVVPSVQGDPVIRDLLVNGNPWTDTILKVAYTFRHGPSDTQVTAVTVGIGRDNQDKGANKAMTQSLKYALMQILMISDDADDSDSQDAPSGRAPVWQEMGYPDEERFNTAREGLAAIWGQLNEEQLAQARAFVSAAGFKVRWPLPQEFSAQLARFFAELIAGVTPAQESTSTRDGTARAPSAADLERAGVIDDDVAYAEHEVGQMTAQMITDGLVSRSLSRQGTNEERKRRLIAQITLESANSRTPAAIADIEARHRPERTGEEPFTD